jgi:hypothetical protein
LPLFYKPSYNSVCNFVFSHSLTVYLLSQIRISMEYSLRPPLFILCLLSEMIWSIYFITGKTSFGCLGLAYFITNGVLQSIACKLLSELITIFLLFQIYINISHACCFLFAGHTYYESPNLESALCCVQPLV